MKSCIAFPNVCIIGKRQNVKFPDSIKLPAGPTPILAPRVIGFLIVFSAGFGAILIGLNG